MVLRNFAVLEGCDGSGTTTQLELLSRRFAGIPGLFYPTAEPTGGPVGKLIRDLLKGGTRVSEEGLAPKEDLLPEGSSVYPETLARLFAADRAEHLYGPGGIVERCSARGELVVSDRYSPSSLVYQAIDCGEELPRILNGSFPFPELLVYLDIESETAEKRIAGRPDRQIFEYLEFQKKVREGYLKLLPAWEKSGVRVVSLDGSCSSEEVAEEVWRAVAEMPIVKKAL
jgi:dTMP kinase